MTEALISRVTGQQLTQVDVDALYAMLDEVATRAGSTPIHCDGGHAIAALVANDGTRIVPGRCVCCSAAEVTGEGEMTMSERDIQAAADALVHAERDPDDIGARYAYNLALEWAASMIEGGYAKGDRADAHAIAMTIRAGKKQPAIADPSTYQETWEEAVATEHRHAAAAQAATNPATNEESHGP